VYGLTCHPARKARKGRGAAYARDGEPLGQTYSRLDRYGLYASDGTKLGSSCGCEDYPCCGH